MARTNDWKHIDEVCRQLGIQKMPPDHPVYAEGPTITLSSHSLGAPDAPPVYVWHLPRVSRSLPDPSEPRSCPFCESTGECPHLLVLMDASFQQVQGGRFADAFLECLEEHPRYEVDCIEAFNELTDGVSDRSTTMRRHYEEGGPGQSSLIMACYGTCEDDIQKVSDYLRPSRRGHERPVSEKGERQ
jgi:hypothetical protein